MNDNQWQTLGTVAPADLVETRNAIHAAAEWPSRAARAALPAADDDSHANLGWQSEPGLLTSRDLGAGHVIGLSVATLSLTHLHNTETRDQVDLAGKDASQVGGWIATATAADREGLSAPLPSSLPADVTKFGSPFATANPDALKELSNWFGNCAALIEGIAAREEGASEVRCWPHHLDIATLITLAGHGEEATTIGVGMSPGDEGYAQPYLYVTPWPYPTTENLPALPAIGHWHREGYVAAVATADRIVDVADQQAAAEEFLTAAIAACKTIHGIS